jgi:hypothetical protein
VAGNQARPPAEGGATVSNTATIDITGEAAEALGVTIGRPRARNGATTGAA